MTRKNIFSICLVELQTIRGFSDDMVYFVKRMKNSLLKIQ